MNTWLTAFNDTVIHPVRDKVYRRVMIAIDLICLVWAGAVFAFNVVGHEGPLLYLVYIALIAFWVFSIYANPIRWACDDYDRGVI